MVTEKSKKFMERYRTDEEFRKRIIKHVGKYNKNTKGRKVQKKAKEKK